MTWIVFHVLWDHIDYVWILLERLVILCIKIISDKAFFKGCSTVTQSLKLIQVIGFIPWEIHLFLSIKQVFVVFIHFQLI